MKQDILTYLEGDFTDFDGIRHPVVICARSTTDDSYLCVPQCGFVEEFDVIRSVHIGVAICNPMDEFDIEIGKKIAEKRTYNTPKIVSLEPGVINNDLINTLLKNELEHINKFPGKYIAGYKEKLDNKIKFNSICDKIESLTKVEINIVDAYLDGVDVEKCLKLAKDYRKYM